MGNSVIYFKRAFLHQKELGILPGFFFIGENILNNIRYTDDTALMAGAKKTTQSIRRDRTKCTEL